MSISINSISDNKQAPSSVKEYFQAQDIFAFMKEDILELSSSEDSKAPEIKPFYIDIADLKKYFDNINKPDSNDLKNIVDNVCEDDIFKSFDTVIQQMKKDTEEYVKYLKEYRELVEKRKRIQQQKALDKIDLMKKTGKLLISGLSPESTQLVMRRSPEMMSDFRQQENYKEKIYDNRQQTDDDTEKFYEEKFDSGKDLENDMLIRETLNKSKIKK